MPLHLLDKLSYSILKKYIDNDKKVTTVGNVELVEVEKIGTFNIILKNIKELSKYFGG